MPTVRVVRKALGTANEPVEMPEGATYREAVVAAGLGRVDPPRLRIVAGDRMVTPDRWDEEIGDQPTVIRQVPGLPSPALFPIFGFGLTPTVNALGSVAVGAGSVLSYTGVLPLLVIDPPSTDLGGGSGGAANSPTLNGARNQLYPYKPVWRLYGEFRLTFPYAARPYRRIVGGEQTFFGLFTAGTGPVVFDIASLRIGETPLSEFANVQVQIDEGDGIVKDVDLATGTKTPTGQPMEVFSLDVHELSVQTLYPIPEYLGNRGPVSSWTEPQAWTDAPLRTTQGDIRRSEIDFVFPQGIATVDRKSFRHKVKLTFDLRQRHAAEPGVDHGGGVGLPGPWGPPDQLLDGGDTFQFSNNADPNDGVRFSWEELHEGLIQRSFTVVHGSSPSQWDVQVRKYATSRLTAAAQPEFIIGQAQWTVLRSIRPEDPVTLPGLSLLAIKIKATDQVQGTLDTFNGVVQALIPTWDGSTWSAPMATSNPAWIYADLLRGSATGKPVADNRIDLSRLLEFSAFCASGGWQFNGVFDFETTLQAAINAVLSVARATYSNREGRHSVVFDREQASVVQLITPRNSISSTGVFRYPDLPHAVRARFMNADKDWEQDERIVYADGYGFGTASQFLDMQLFGVTGSQQAWKLADYHLRVLALRSGSYERTLDWEYLVCERGDLVRLSDDVFLGDVSATIVTGVSVDGSNRVTSITVDEDLTYLPGVSYGIAARSLVNAGALSVPRYTATNPATTDPVTSRTITFTTPLDEIATGEAALEVGWLVVFGEAGFETTDCLVVAVRPGQEMTATLTLVDYAPEVYNTGAPIPPFTSAIRASRFAQPPPPILGQPTQGGAYVRVPVRISQRLATQVDATLIQAQYRASGGSEWTRLADLPPDAREIVLVGLEPGVTYEIRARTAATGTFSAWVTTGIEFTGDSISVDQYRVVGLQLVNGVDRTRFAGRTAHFGWRLAYTSGVDLTHAQVDAPFQAIPNSNLLDFVVRVRDAQSLEIIREETVRGFSWDYTLEKQYEDPGPLRREFTVQVAFKDPAGDAVGEFQTITVENRVPALTTASVQRSLAGAIVTFSPSSDPDWAGIVVWASSTPGFTPNALTELYRGTVNPAIVTIGLANPYVRWAHYDHFAVDPATNSIDPTVLAISPETALTGTGQIDTGDITPGAITDIFVEDFEDPIGTGNLLQTTPGQTDIGSIVVSNADDEAKVLLTLYLETSCPIASAYNGEVQFVRNGVNFRLLNFSGVSSTATTISSTTLVVIDSNPIVGVNTYELRAARINGGNIELGARTITAQLFKR